jgi:hypothetical protein
MCDKSAIFSEGIFFQHQRRDQKSFSTYIPSSQSNKACLSLAKPRMLREGRKEEN